MPKKVKNRKIIVIDRINSPYFEQGVLILKDGTISEDDKIINEANKVVTEYVKKYEPKFTSNNKLYSILASAAVILSLLALLNTLF